MKAFALILAGLALAVAGCSKPAPKASSAAPAAAPAPPRPGAALRLPEEVRPVSYRIDLTPDTQALTFTGSETIQVQASQSVPSISLNALELTITRATLDGRPATKVTLDPAKQTVTL